VAAVHPIELVRDALLNAASSNNISTQ